MLAALAAILENCGRFRFPGICPPNILRNVSPENLVNLVMDPPSSFVISTKRCVGHSSSSR